jgi:hypothetical protein
MVLKLNRLRMGNVLEAEKIVVDILKTTEDLGDVGAEEKGNIQVDHN